ncbi:MAG TPA: class I SAM-dependent methyltransferase [Actinomycetota bacterium]
MTDVYERIREFWDRDAATYDHSASHSASDPTEAAAWRAALRRALPEPPATVLDAGAGTGSLSLLAAELGYRVTSLDLSEAMLSKAREKAETRGLELSFEVGSAMTPPQGPFDAVMERHVLWTMPDPGGALRAWRDATVPGGRLVIFEGIWGSRTPADRAMHVAAKTVRRMMGEEDHHHASYPDEVLEALPLARMPSPAPLVGAVREAGWSGVRIQRLRDVEWAARLHEPWPLGWLEHHSRYAIVADKD